MGENKHNERPNNLTHCVVLCCILIFLLKFWFLKGSCLRQRLTYHFNLYVRAQSSQGKSETDQCHYTFIQMLLRNQTISISLLLTNTNIEF